MLTNEKRSRSKERLSELTFKRTLLEHLFKDFQPGGIIIDNKNSKTSRKRIASRGRETIVHHCQVKSDARIKRQNSENGKCSWSEIMEERTQKRERGS